MGKSRCRLLRNAMLCGSLLSLGPAGAIELWTVGGNGFTWDEVGDLTGLTIEGSVLLPAVVDSTTNAADNLPLRRRGGSISSPQAREDLTGLVTDGSAETFWRVTRERRPDGTCRSTASASKAIGKYSCAPTSFSCTTATQRRCARACPSPI